MQPPPSHWVDLDGPVHYVDFGGPDPADPGAGAGLGGRSSGREPVLVCVHGLGGSHINWLALAPLLTSRHRVLALDLPGFGLTRGLGRATSVQASAVLVRRFIDEVLGDEAPVVLVGNSMGGLITMLVAAADPDRLHGAVLVDPAVPPSFRTRPDPLTTAMFAAYFTPGLGKVVLSGRQKVRTHEQLAMDTLRLCCSDPARVPALVVEAHVRLAQTRPRYQAQEGEFVAASRSIMKQLARRKAFQEMATQIRCPVLMLHGDRDRLVSIASATAMARANPSWGFAIAPGVGHVPQLEAPQWTAEQVLGWLSTLPATPHTLATPAAADVSAAADAPDASYIPAAALPSQ